MFKLTEEDHIKINSAISSCCDFFDSREDAVGYCPDCGFPVGGDGYAVAGCTHSPIVCLHCRVCYCDGSC